MSEQTERRARGDKFYREVTTTEPPPVQDAYMEFTMDEVFGDVWSRPGLTRKERRFITLTCVAMTGAPTALQSHVSAAINSGDISAEEMIEWCVHLAHYGGWPLSSSAYTAIQTALGRA